jgi:hypothetical protein
MVFPLAVVNTILTADFSVIDPYRMMRTDGSAERSTRPIVHVWCVRVNINATCYDIRILAAFIL